MQTINRLKSNRPRKKHDFYETPYELAREAIKVVFLDEKMNPKIRGLDAGSGGGVWGKAFKNWFPDSPNVGIDINAPFTDDNYTSVIKNDFLVKSVPSGYGFDLVYGNPPYSLAEEFVRRGLEVGKYVYFLLRLAFLESQKRHFGLYSEFPPKRVYVLSRRPSFFSSNGKRKTTDALSYAMFLWQKGYKGKPELDWLYWEYDK